MRFRHSSFFKAFQIIIFLTVWGLCIPRLAFAEDPNPTRVCKAKVAGLAGSAIDPSSRKASGSARKGTKASSKRPQIFVLDTNTFHHNPEVLSQFPGAEIVIPQAVLDELDHRKYGYDERAKTARAVNRTIRDLLDRHPKSVSKMKYEKSLVSIVDLDPSTAWPRFFTESNDNRIILTARQVQEQHPEADVVFITGDNALVSRARVQGVKNVQGLSTAGRTTDVHELLESHLKVPLTDDQASGLVGKTSLRLEEVREMGLKPGVQPRDNQFLVFYPISAEESFVKRISKGGPKEFSQEAFNQALSLVWRFHRLAGGEEVFSPVDRDKISKLTVLPRNNEQIRAADAILDPRIRMVSLSGVAGSGKTLISLAAAISQLKFFGGGRFDKIILVRGNYMVGNDMGFLPGTLHEKAIEHMGAFKDNLAIIISALRRKAVRIGNGVTGRRDQDETISLDDVLSDKLTPEEAAERLLGPKSPIFKIQPVSHSRGRTWDNACIIVDETQNLSVHEVKTIGSRAGDGSLVLLLGDPEQIDNPKVNSANNGLVQAAHAFRIGEEGESEGASLSAHIDLRITERSRISALFANLLRN